MGTSVVIGSVFGGATATALVVGLDDVSQQVACVWAGGAGIPMGIVAEGAARSWMESSSEQELH